MVVFRALVLVLAACVTVATGLRTGLRAAWYSNSMLAPSSPSSNNCSGVITALSLEYTDAASIACEGSAAQRPSLELFTARFDGTLTAPAPGSWEFRVVTNGGVRLWVDDHIIVDSSCDTPFQSPLSPFSPAQHSSFPDRDHPRKGPVCGSWDTPNGTVTLAGRDNVTHHIEQGLHIRLEWLHAGGGPARLALYWRPGTPSTVSTHPGGGFVTIPASALSPTLSRAEEWRQALQRGLSKGWNTWMRDNAMRTQLHPQPTLHRPIAIAHSHIRIFVHGMSG